MERTLTPFVFSATRSSSRSACLGALPAIAAALLTTLWIGWWQGARAEFLQGGVEHSDSLPPVDSRLRSGSQFDEHYFDKVVPNNLWVPIPAWFAGVWQTRSETMLQKIDLQDPSNLIPCPQTFVRNDSWTFGMQVDSTGQIWHFINVPSYRKVKFGDDYEYRYELSKDFSYTGEDRVSAKYRFIAFSVEGASQRILDSRQQETQWHFTPAMGGNMRADNSFKVFTPAGLPLSYSRNRAPFYRVRPFTPIDTYAGIDMRKSFRDYLISHQMTDRVPASADKSLPFEQR